ncbi:MAG: Type I Iterative PKS [Alyxoria varia]|nr:MAG: Type I Iterative PKS [Alyxoria varia]
MPALNDPNKVPRMSGNMMPIAITGMACRLPGGVSSPEELWDGLAEGYSGWSEIPPDRFEPAAFHHPDPNKKNAQNSKGAHFLKHDISLFDAPFFNISAAEANAMDPQQRILLEVTYEALESSGSTIQDLSGKSVGVFVGASHSDYADRLRHDMQTLPMFEVTGTCQAILSNRVSWAFNLKGPSATVDTACSSGLTALHLACQGLRAGETTEAIVAGSHLLASADEFITLSNLQLLSGDGKCYAFDERATGGFGRGEGVACMTLKPLDAAVAAGDPIRAVVCNSGLNQDGRDSAGLTVPSVNAQKSLIDWTYRTAGLSPDGTDFVEAHGTGTRVGDPIELESLGTSFGNLEKSPRTHVGSLKSNIGHLEGASGIVSLIKVAMMVEKGFILPNCDFRAPNKDCPPSQFGLEVPTRLLPWRKSSGARTASVNNFGFGGSNGHVIVQQYLGPKTDTNHASINGSLNGSTNGVHLNGNCPNDEGLWAKETSRRSQSRLFVLSANSQQSLQQQAAGLVSYLRDPPFTPYFLSDLAYTLGQRRSLHSWRLAVTASNQQELQSLLYEKMYTKNRASKAPTLGFVFTGQGSQWPMMGCRLMEWSLDYCSSVKESDKILRNLGSPWSLLDELSSEAHESQIGTASISQPACTAVQIALVDMLRSWNVNPSAVTGHSSGEIAAAYAADILTKEQCLKIAYHRGVVGESLGGNGVRHIPGTMVALGVGPQDAQVYIDQVKRGHAIIACVNSSRSVTISGDEDAVSEVQSLAQNEQTFARRLKVDVAYHSKHMERVADKYEKSLGCVEPNETSEVAFFSALRGKRCANAELGADYWIKNLTNPVLFSSAVQALCRNSIDHVVEIGPHGSLATPTKDCIKSTGNSIDYMSTLSRGEDDVKSVLRLAAGLFVKGYPISLGDVNGTVNQSRKPAVLTDLPSYPWYHETRYWHDSRKSEAKYHPTHPPHDVLGINTDISNDFENSWRNILSAEDLPWLTHHRVQHDNVFPMAGYVSIALEAMRQKTYKSQAVIGFEFRDISILAALIVPDSTEVETLFYLRPYKGECRSSQTLWNEFKLISWTSERGWTEHVSGLVAAIESQGQGALEDASSSTHDVLHVGWPSDDSIHLDMVEAYKAVSDAGIDFGTTFKNLSGVRIRKDHAAVTASSTIPMTRAEMPAEVESDYLLHPATMDSFLQLLGPIMHSTQEGMNTPLVPTSIKSLTVNARLASCEGHQFRCFGTSESVPGFSKQKKLNVDIYDLHLSDSTPAVSIRTVSFTQLASDAPPGATNPASPCAKVVWNPYIPLIPTSQYEGAFGLEVPGESLLQRVRQQEQASYYYIEEALKVLSDDDIKSSHLQKMYRWMKTQRDRAAQGSLKLQTSEWMVKDRETREACKQAVRAQGPNGDFICHMGEHLASIMREDVDTLSVMLAEDRLGKMYQAQESMTRTYEIASQYVDALAHQWPAMHILEIGAGTGGATKPILDRLRGNSADTFSFSHYDFTDISSGFFGEAKEKFQEFGHRIQYRTLNVEEDPSAQGFAEGKYDLIVASNVLHATKSMHNTLAHTRKLLRPGGKLMLIEITSLGLSQFPFGTTTGWWLAEDSKDIAPCDGFSYRQQGPTLTESQWDMVLTNTGFSGVDGAASDFKDCDEHGMSAIFTTAVEEHCRTPEKQRNLLVISNSGQRVLDSAAILSRTSLASTCSIKTASLDQLQGIDLGSTECLVIDSSEAPIMKDIEPELVNSLQNLVTASSIIWVAHGSRPRSPFYDMAKGLLNSVRTENEELLKISTLEFNNSLDFSVPKDQDAFTKAVKHALAYNSPTAVDGEELELRYDGHRFSIPRYVRDSGTNKYISSETDGDHLELQAVQQPSRPLRLTMQSPGNLDTLHFEDDPSADTPLSADEVEIRPEFFGLNFKEVLIAMGQLPGFFASECSGTVTRAGSNVTNVSVGDRVCAFAVRYSTFTRCPSSCVARIPGTLNFDTAAALPIVYCTAYYCLIEVARLSHGESVLIHAAAGGLGQAAISLAQMVGANIYATVSTPEKRNHLVKEYGIPTNRIFYSRSTSFSSKVMEATGSRGVDVCLNSLAGEQLRKSWQCMAPFGRFVEVGKRDIVANSRLEMGGFERNVTFTGVDLTTLPVERPNVMQRMMSEIVDLYSKGTIHEPTPISQFTVSEIPKAMRTLSSGKGMGKIVINFNSPESSENKVLAAKPRQKGDLLRSDATYLITGGTGGIGRSACRWLIANGARTVVLTSRSGASQPDARKLKDELEAKVKGATIDLISCDMGDRPAVKTMLDDVKRRHPPVRGLIHGAMYLKDQLFEGMSHEHIMRHIDPKVGGAIALAEELLPPPESPNVPNHSSLEFFISLSSLSGVIGNQGQAPYAAASVFLDGFTQTLRAQYPNLRASVIDLGVVAEVGYVAQNKEVQASVQKTYGGFSLSEKQVLALLKAGIKGVLEVECGGQTLAGLVLPQEDGGEAPVVNGEAAAPQGKKQRHRPAIFSHIRREAAASPASSTNQQASDDVDVDDSAAQKKKLTSPRQLLSTLTSPTKEDITAILTDSLTAKLSAILMIPTSDIAPEQRLSEYGVDSLVAVELRNWLARELEVSVSMPRLMAAGNLEGVVGMCVKDSGVVKGLGLGVGNGGEG